MDSKSLAPVGSFRYAPGNYSFEGMYSTLCEVMSDLLAGIDKPLLLLSGGVDSTVLVKLMLTITEGNFACLTIGGSWDHPDMIAALRLSQHMPFVNIEHVPQKDDIARADKILESSGTKVCPGDNGVFLILEKAAALGYTDVIAGDGIDEQVGGYWQHVNPEGTLPVVFEGFWDKLDLEHLGPMARSAELANITVHWPYMDERVVEYISRIPLEKRVEFGIQKHWWKEFAKYIGVPTNIADRPKQGFVHALEREEE